MPAEPHAQSNAAERYSAFDALRASMMALGIAIHSATAYSTIDDVWWIKDPQTSQWFDVLVLFLHTFRLPAFFVMAGFFAALLVERRGWQKMVENRMMRLGLPMILGILFVWTPLRLTSVYFHYLGKGGDAWTQTLDWIYRGRLAEDIEPGHFWFLETLVWVTLLALVLHKSLARLEGQWFRRMMGTWMGIVALTAVSAVTLMVSEFGILDTPHSLSPHWHIVAAYGVFYAYGWGMYQHREALWLMTRFGWTQIWLALLLLAPAMAAIQAQLNSRDTRLWGPYLATAVLTAAMAWLMIHGLTGVFLRHFSVAGSGVRYLSDSAYWIYVMHPPALLAIQIPMMTLDWNPWLKFVIGIVWAVPLLLLSYDRLARPSWIGLVLNGRRMERWSRCQEQADRDRTAAMEAAAQEAD